MSEREAPEPAAEAAPEPLLARWSRLKADARARDARPPETAAPELPPGQPPSSVADGPAAASVTAAPAPAPAPSTAAPVELPDLDQLDQDSDFSAFLTPGVDAELRRRALRKLFHSPKFNVFDGLDTYRDDFTQFSPLGGVVTADMQYHLERAAKELAARVEAGAGRPAEEPAIIERDPSPAPQLAVDGPAPPPADVAAGPDDTPRNEDDAEHGPA